MSNMSNNCNCNCGGKDPEMEKYCLNTKKTKVI